MSKNNGLGITNPGKDYDILCKIVVIGDSGVGKTSLLQRFAEQHFSGKMKARLIIKILMFSFF